MLYWRTGLAQSAVEAPSGKAQMRTLWCVLDQNEAGALLIVCGLERIGMSLRKTFKHQRARY
jgi:hypothetical protein